MPIKLPGELGFPIIIRAAYTLGGQGSGFCYNEDDLDKLGQEGLFLFSPDPG